MMPSKSNFEVSNKIENISGRDSGQDSKISENPKKSSSLLMVIINSLPNKLEARMPIYSSFNGIYIKKYCNDAKTSKIRKLKKSILKKD